jgi:hypothetical protein
MHGDAGSYRDRLETLRICHPVRDDGVDAFVGYARSLFALAASAVSDCELLRAELERLHEERGNE